MPGTISHTRAVEHNTQAISPLLYVNEVPSALFTMVSPAIIGNRRRVRSSRLAGHTRSIPTVWGFGDIHEDEYTRKGGDGCKSAKREIENSSP